MKQSWSVLRLDKELMLFPILSSIACVLVLASFAAPVILVPDLRDSLLQYIHSRNNPDGNAPTGFRGTVPTIIMACFYLVNYFVIIFFNTALVSCAVKRFSGGDPTVGYGISAACSRLPQILAWTLLAATVGIILNAIEERVKFVGKIVVNLLGMAWTIVTFLVIPVLAVERVGPFRAVRRSAELLSKTWGEALVGNVSLGIAGFLLALPGIFMLVGAPLVLAATESFVIAGIMAVVGLLYLIGVSVLTSTLRQILIAGLYCYAAEGVVPSGFSEDIMRSAFRHK